MAPNTHHKVLRQGGKKSSSSRDPVAHVFGIAELFLQILNYIHFPTLLTSAIRVNRHWNGVIEETPELQRRLFFQLPLIQPSTPDKIKINPFLRRFLTLTRKAETMILRRKDQSEHYEKLVEMQAERSRRRQVFWSRLLCMPLKPPPPPKVSLMCAPDDRPTDAFLRPDASWRSMLLRNRAIDGLTLDPEEFSQDRIAVCWLYPENDWGEEYPKDEWLNEHFYNDGRGMLLVDVWRMDMEWRPLVHVVKVCGICGLKLWNADGLFENLLRNGSTEWVKREFVQFLDDDEDFD